MLRVEELLVDGTRNAVIDSRGESCGYTAPGGQGCGLLTGLNEAGRPLAMATDAVLESDVRARGVPGGVDLVVTITNPTDRDVPMQSVAGPAINLGGIDVGRTLRAFDFGATSEPWEADLRPSSARGCGSGARCEGGTCVPAMPPCTCDAQCGGGRHCVGASASSAGRCEDRAPSSCTPGETADWASSSSWFGPLQIYPDDLYSPVAVIRGVRGGSRTYTMGVSVLYPVVEYQHAFELWLVRAYGERRLHLRLGVQEQFAQGCRPGCGMDAMVPAHAERTYTIALRFVPDSDIDADATHAAWLRALVPYRNYVADQYGGVSYTRDPRPVAPYVPAAEPSHHAPENPRAYRGDRTTWPTTAGWGPIAAQIAAFRTDAAITRAMLWSPTGVYYGNGIDVSVNPHATDDREAPGLHPSMAPIVWGPDERSLSNFPALILSPMIEGSPLYDPVYATAAASLDALAALPASGTVMGYYHGYAGVHHARWNPRTDEGVCVEDETLRCVDNLDCPLFEETLDRSRSGCTITARDPASEARNTLFHEIETIDPYDTRRTGRGAMHRDAVFREYDIAVHQLGASEIGMDAITVLPLWDAYRWIRELRERYPGVRFTGETTPSDLFVLHAGAYLFGNVDPHGPHALADFVTPGHESWLSPHPDTAPGACAEFATRPFPMPDEPAYRDAMARFAAMGFVLVPSNYPIDARDAPSRYEAARSWIATVPEDLRDVCRPELYR
jgi:hypothetical protein